MCCRDLLIFYSYMCLLDCHFLYHFACILKRIDVLFPSSIHTVFNYTCVCVCVCVCMCMRNKSGYILQFDVGGSISFEVFLGNVR